jgi:hypothetical protein
MTLLHGAGLRHALLLTTLLLAACGRHPIEPPLLSLGSRACESQPVFEHATPLSFDTLSGAYAKLGAEGRCMQAPGAEAPTTYAVFDIPQGTAPAALSIASLAAGTLVSPRVTLFDASGTAVRALNPGDFRANVGGLQTGMRLRGNERWLVVEADHALLGKSVTLRLGDGHRGDVQVAAVMFIYVPPPTHADIMRENDVVYALNGTIRVTMTKVPTIP